MRFWSVTTQPSSAADVIAPYLSETQQTAPCACDCAVRPKSIANTLAAEGLSVYNATKAAIRSFARTWTLELKHRKIRVNAISPGSIYTPIFNPVMSEEEYEQFKNNVTKTMPMGRMGSPDEVAKAFSFLASDDASYITGIELFVDGGVAQI
jgi:NAD(P)-dependent dehydrogenase (short-subunit alcohol dehydrogenase family)